MAGQGKTYILYSEWGGTATNHAGMAYLVARISQDYKSRVRLIKIPGSIAKWPYLLQRIHFHSLVYFLKWVLKDYDKVLFIEYMGVASGNQNGIANNLRRKGVRAKFFGMVHLSGDHLLELYESEEHIRDAAQNVDKIIVLGSALASFFGKLGYKQKVIQTFHYVDNEYYKPSTTEGSRSLQVIHMGCHKRDFNLLQKIVAANPEIHFHICEGYLDLQKQFSHFKNVKLYSYLSEAALLEVMHSCNVSLSVMEDAVGSNVISCSMACGLVNVVSDVGSIRDYCNEKNSILCKNLNDFSTALKTLGNDSALLEDIRLNSLAYSAKLSIDASIEFFHREVILS